MSRGKGFADSRTAFANFHVLNGNLGICLEPGTAETQHNRAKP